MNKNRLQYLLIAILFVWCLILSGRTGDGKISQNANVINQYEVDGFSTDLTRVVEDARPSVVAISADNGILSGFVYRQEGEDVYIVSAYHGVSNVSDIEVYFGSSYTVQAELIGHDIYCDLAVLRIRSPYLIAPLKTSDSSFLKAGEFLISIGTPSSLDLQGTVELCMVSGSGRQIENSILVDGERYQYYLNVIELGSSFSQGFSGSPLINMNGEAVGMNTMSLSPNTGFALSINEVKIVADQLIANGQVSRSFPGVKGTFIRDLYNYEKSNLNIGIEVIDGFYVERLKENGQAYLAGVRSGDVITSINGVPISDLNSYLNALYSPQNDFSVEFLRNGQAMSGVLSND